MQTFDYMALPSVPGLRKKPSCLVKDFLCTPIEHEQIFSFVEQALRRRNNRDLIVALMRLRNPKARLSNRAIMELRTFSPLDNLIDWAFMSKLDNVARDVTRNNHIVRMVAGQRTVSETMSKLHIGAQTYFLD